MKKIFFVLVIGFSVALFSTVFQSCYKDKCGGNGPGYAYLESLIAERMAITGTDESSYGQGWLVFSLADSSRPIKYDSVILEVTHDFLAAREKTKPFLGIDAAYACSLRINYEKVREFVITSTADYDAQHPAGTNLADIMRIRTDRTKNVMTFAEFALPYNGNSEIDASALYFSFASAPVKSNTHNITIKYSLTNGKEFMTKPIHINIKN